MIRCGTCPNEVWFTVGNTKMSASKSSNKVTGEFDPLFT